MTSIRQSDVATGGGKLWPVRQRDEWWFVHALAFGLLRRRRHGQKSEPDPRFFFFCRSECYLDDAGR